jgi:ATP-binding cassette, subfamily F, member 2
MYEWEQDQIAHMKEYIARFGHGSAKLAKQAQSKEKTLAKMQAGGLTEKVVMEKTVKLHFHQCGSLPPPVLQFTNVTFGYTPDKILYSKLDFGVDLDSRIALVGPNGAGKSTLLKLMVHELECLDGIVRRHPHLRIARFHQHLTDLLDPELTPLEYIIKEFSPMEPTVARSQIGRFGITGDAQTAKMKNLSDGQKSRVRSSGARRLKCGVFALTRIHQVAFSWIAAKKPHLLLLDEPTNHLDLETIDSLARAINEFDGGCVLVSHDFRLIQQVGTRPPPPAQAVVQRPQPFELRLYLSFVSRACV